MGCNPKKPGLPSHTYHTDLVAGLRLVLEAEGLAGTESRSNHTLPGLLRLLDQLAPAQRPYLARSDCDLGSGRIMSELEQRGQHSLFKLRLTKRVKQYIERRFFGEPWSDAGAGWAGLEGELRLTGWDQERRVVLLRRPLQGEVLPASQNDSQQVLAFIEEEVPVRRYAYAVLVASLPPEVRTIAQRYRDRADAENSFDELKTPWGWGGFTTQDLHRCQLAAER